MGTSHFGGYIRLIYLKKSLKDIIKKNNNRLRILDVGCGDGSYDFYITRKYKTVDIDAIDINNELIRKNTKISRELNLPVSFIKKDITLFHPRHRYDIALSMDSLEHIKKIDLAITNMYNSLRSGGIIIIHLPQKNWWEISFFNKSNFKDFICFEKKEHINARYALPEFSELLIKKGFKIIQSRKTFGYVSKFAWEINQLLLERKYYNTRLIILPLLKMTGIIDYYMPNKKGCGIFVVAKKSK